MLDVAPQIPDWFLEISYEASHPPVIHVRRGDCILNVVSVLLYRQGMSNTYYDCTYDQRLAIDELIKRLDDLEAFE